MKKKNLRLVELSYQQLRKLLGFYSRNFCYDTKLYCRIFQDLLLIFSRNATLIKSCYCVREKYVQFRNLPNIMNIVYFSLLL